MKDLLNREHDVEKIAELPHREKMQMRDHRYRHGYSYPANKIERFLKSNIGVNWDVVYSKYIAADWVPEYYKNLETIKWDVVVDTFIKNGEVYYLDTRDGIDCHIDTHFYYKTGKFYVHPVTKLLCKQKPRKEIKKKKEETYRILGNYHQLVKIDGIWHELKGEPLKSESDEVVIDGLHYNIVKFVREGDRHRILDGKILIPTPRPYDFGGNYKKIGPRDLMVDVRKDRSHLYSYSKYNYGSIKITLDRQLNHKELRKYGLVNDMPPVKKRCDICGMLGCNQRHNRQ